MTDPTTVAAIRERLEDLPWARERAVNMCANAYADAAVYGRKLLKGFGYPNETFRAAQDARALEIVLAALDACQREVEQLKAERDKAAAWSELVTRGKSPCGHWKVYAHTEDGGKRIDCWQCRAEQAEAQLATAQEALKKLHPLIEGVWEEHSDCHAIGYNECDIDECSWCEETRALLKEKS